MERGGKSLRGEERNGEKEGKERGKAEWVDTGVKVGRLIVRAEL